MTVCVLSLAPVPFTYHHGLRVRHSLLCHRRNQRAISYTRVTRRTGFTVRLHPRLSLPRADALSGDGTNEQCKADHEHSPAPQMPRASCQRAGTAAALAESLDPPARRASYSTLDSRARHGAAPSLYVRSGSRPPPTARRTARLFRAPGAGGQRT